MKRGNAVLAITVVLALAATALVYMYLKGADRRGTNAAQITVLVSKSDIPANADLSPLIRDGDFTTRTIPSDDLLQGAITDVRQLQGHRTAYPILAGEQIVMARLQGDDQIAGGSLGISPGHVAVTVKLGDEQSDGGAVGVGDHVTVYATFQNAQVIKGGLRSILGPGTAQAQPQPIADFTVTLVPTVRVLRVQTPTDSASGSQTGDVLLTLDLTKQDAQNVVFARNSGIVWVGLLPPGESGRHVPASTLPLSLLLNKSFA